MKKDLLNKLINIYLVFLIVGFFFIGIVPKLIGFTEGALSVPYRAVILMISLFIISYTLLYYKISSAIWNNFFLFLFFWIMYTVRIIYDLFFTNIFLAPGTKPSEYIQFAFGVVLIPSLCVMLIAQVHKINYDWVLKWIYRVLFITLCIAIYTRAGSEVGGRTAGDINVGVISFGQFGATLSLLSLFRLYAGKNNKLYKVVFYIIGFLIGFIGIFISASKSPLLALVVVSLFFTFLWYGGIKSGLLFSIISIIIYLFFVDFIYSLNSLFNSNFLERILYAIEMGGDNTRENYMITAFIEFIDNPFFGNAILIQEYSIAGNYPHNIIVEAFMSLGFLGGVIIIAWILKCIKKIYYSCKTHSANSWIGLLFMQYLVFAMFSGNIFSNNLFWIFSVLSITLYQKNIRKIKYIKE